MWRSASDSSTVTPRASIDFRPAGWRFNRGNAVGRFPFAHASRPSTWMVRASSLECGDERSDSPLWRGKTRALRSNQNSRVSNSKRRLRRLRRRSPKPDGGTSDSCRTSPRFWPRIGNMNAIGAGTARPRGIGNGHGDEPSPRRFKERTADAILSAGTLELSGNPALI
jgi:hypothetical protein